MKVTPVVGAFPAGYKKPKAFVYIRQNKTTIINAATGEKTEFDDPVKAWQFKAELDA